jgi:hypothetical protein
MSNLSDFLNENKITADQVVERSAALEQLSLADREKKVAREVARVEKKSYTDAGIEKPAGLGRGVSHRSLRDALAGTPVPRTARKKITRAVNSLLVSQKKSEVEWRALFADVGARKGKSKAKGK